MITVQNARLIPANAIYAQRQANGSYTVYLPGDTAPANTNPLIDAKARKIAAINDECRARLVSRFGPAEEQVSRSLAVYGEAEREAMRVGIGATIDAANAAQDSALVATTIPNVEAVTVAWPVI